MKRTFISVAVAMVSVARCFSATLGEEPRTFPVLIAHERGSGSGCLLRMSNSVYLVTAKHVLFGTNAPRCFRLSLGLSRTLGQGRRTFRHARSKLISVNS